MDITASKVMELRRETGVGMMSCKKALAESKGDVALAKDYLRKKGLSVAQSKALRKTSEGAVGLVFSEDSQKGAMALLACETDFVARNEGFQSLLGKISQKVLLHGEEGLEEQALEDGKNVQESIVEAISSMGENLQLEQKVRLEASSSGVVAGYVHSNQKIGVLVMLEAEKEAQKDVLEALARDVAMHIAASQVHALTKEDLNQEMVEKERAILMEQAKDSGKPQEVVEKMVEGRLNKFLREVVLLHQPFVKDPSQTIEQLLKAKGKELGVSLKIATYRKLQVGGN